MPRISVLMGIYNCASYLQEALDSLYAQTYQDFKIILCDDGSSDNTYAIAKANADVHDNILLVKNERNMGLNYTLNHCLKYADTEYCARMDGDDVSLSDRFQKEVDFLDTHPEYAIVSTPMIYFDEVGDFGAGHGGYEPDVETFIYGTPFCHAPCMVRTSAYTAVGGYTVDNKLLRVEDYHLWMKMMKSGLRGYVLDECLYRMRDDRNAIKRRTLRGAFRECRAHLLACHELKLPLYGYLFSVAPILKAMLPTSLYTFLHKQKMQSL